MNFLTAHPEPFKDDSQKKPRIACSPQGRTSVMSPAGNISHLVRFTVGHGGSGSGNQRVAVVVRCSQDANGGMERGLCRNFPLLASNHREYDIIRDRRRL